MNEEEIRFFVYVSGFVKKSPKFVQIAIDAITHGVTEKNKELIEKVTLRDKALLVLFEGSNCGSDQNLVECAETLTDNSFNGTYVKYTIEDIIPFMKQKKYKRIKKGE